MIKVTKKQLKEYVQNLMTHYIQDMGDSRFSPDVHAFYYRGVASPAMHSAVESIISDLEHGGIDLPMDKDALVKEILINIRKLVMGNNGI